jgi:hypothetical protein
MIPLHSVLAIQDVMHKVPLLAAIVCAAILAIAFIIGFAKGFRRVSWGGVVWAASGFAFIVGNKLLRNRNPILKMPAVAALDEGMRSFVSSFSIALLCALAGLFAYGVCSLIFKHRRIKKRDPEISIYSGYEYEDDYDDYDDYDAPSHMVDARKKKPNFLGRVLGGIVCAINVTVILALGISFVLLLISATALINGPLGYLFDIKIVPILRNYASVYALDFLTIGIIIVISCKGYKNGLIGSIRSLVVMFGVIIAAVISFWLPFSSFAGSEKAHFLNLLITRWINLLGGVNELIRGLAAKILSGVCIFVLASLVLWLVNFLLAKCSRSIRGSAPARIIDGVLACLLYFVIGVLIVLAMWSVLYLVDYCGIFKSTEIFNENAALAKGMFRFGETYIRPIFDKLLVKA